MKSLKHYLGIIAISLIPFIAIFLTTLAPHTHDSPVHYARIAAYYKALQHGQILPRWAGELNYGYGMPLFNFMYPIPYLVSAFWVFAGSGLVLSFKLSLLLAFVLSGIFMLMFTRKLFKDDGRAFVATLLYQFAPFHLIDLLVRGDMAEGYAFSFLPFLLYALLCLFEEKKGTGAVGLVSVATALLVLSHNAISLVFFGAAVLFALVFAPNWPLRLKAGLGLLLGLGISSFYWLPALIERKYTYGDLFMKDMYLSHFAPIQNFFIPNISNSKTLWTEGIAVWFGIPQVIALGLSVWWLGKKTFKNEMPYLWYGLFLTLAALFVMQPVSKFFWSSVPILRMFQFPWRLLTLTTFSLSLLGGFVLLHKKASRAWVIAIGLLTVLSVAVYFRPPLGFDRIDEPYFWNYPLNTTYFGETDVIWSGGPAGSYPKARFEVIGGIGTITDAVKRDTVHTFTVHADTDVQVVDRTQYFPGWRVYVDGMKTPIEFQDQNWRGLITFEVPKGLHKITVAWGNTPIRTMGSVAALVSALITGLLFVFSKRLKHL